MSAAPLTVMPIWRRRSHRHLAEAQQLNPALIELFTQRAAAIRLKREIPLRT